MLGNRGREREAGGQTTVLKAQCPHQDPQDWLSDPEDCTGLAAQGKYGPWGQSGSEATSIPYVLSIGLFQ